MEQNVTILYDYKLSSYGCGLTCYGGTLCSYLYGTEYIGKKFNENMVYLVYLI